MLRRALHQWLGAKGYTQTRNTQHRQIVGAVTDRSRKLFEEGRHDSAFLLSEVRSRHLAELLSTELGGERRGGRRPRSGSGLTGALGGARTGTLAAMVTVFALALVVSVLWTPGRRADAFTPAELAQLSPFLESGYRNTLGETHEFVGGLTPAWDYLSADQRRRVTAEIGTALRERDIPGAVLKDRWNRVHARFAGGRPQLFDPTLSGRPGR